MWDMTPIGDLDLTMKYQYFGRPKKLLLPDEVWQYGERVMPMSVPLNMIRPKVYLGDFSLVIKAGTPVNYKVQTPFYFCAPERYHGFDPSYATDMWSYMVIFGILYAGNTLFHGGEGDRAMSCMVQTLGPMPPHWNGRYDISGGNSCSSWYDPSVNPLPNTTHETKIRRFRPNIEEEELSLALRVLAKVFRYEPGERITAAQLLNDSEFNELLGRYGC